MALGPGRYDDLCTLVRERVGLTDMAGGGVIIMVVGDEGRSGFSCQADLATMRALPDLLEEVARQIRQDTGA